MSPTQAPGAEAPIKYTKESLLGLKDAWLGFAAARLSKAATMLEQMAEKLPPAVKNKMPRGKSAHKSTESTGANAPS
jgi:hypothetical protein